MSTKDMKDILLLARKELREWKALPPAKRKKAAQEHLKAIGVLNKRGRLTAGLG